MLVLLTARYVSNLINKQLNYLRLQKLRYKYDMHKFYFTNRFVDHWNSLPNSIVYVHRPNINAF